MHRQPSPAPAAHVTSRSVARTLLSLVMLSTLSFLPSPHTASNSIIRRHDVPDSLYIQLGRRYASLVHLNIPVPEGAADGEGTLIAPRWVLTAAHVAAEIGPGHLVAVADQSYRVDSVIRHPEWDDGPNDIALLHLERAVHGVRPARLYRASDEADRVLVLVGYGDVGTGISGPTANDRLVRGATNRVDVASDFWLKMVFDPPESSRTTRLEGVSGPGDSGGPAYVDGDGAEVVVGVSSGQSTRATGGKLGRYGVTDFYTRVSRYVPWIESITGPLPS